MRKLKVFNDGNQPKLWERVILLQLSCAFAYMILRGTESDILPLMLAVLAPVVALFLKD
jgi:hypothetical protein